MKFARAIIIFGIAGLVSGILSSVTFSFLHSLSFAFMPGVIFGFALVCALWIFERRVIKLARSLIFIPTAGIIYLISAIPLVASAIGSIGGDAAPVCGSGFFGCIQPVAVGIDGALGAFILSLVFALIYPRIKLINSLYLTILGGVFGFLGAFITTTKDPTFFFILWQTVVALGFGMSIKHQGLDLKEGDQVIG